MNWKNLRQSTSILMLVIIISKIVGLFRDLILAQYFGTSNISDAYLIASSVPVLLFYFIGHSLSTAYIPMYNKIKYGSNISNALSYSNNLLNISLLLSCLLVIILFLYPNYVVQIFASGFDAETIAISSRLIKLSASSIFFMCVVHIFSGYLQANNSFLPPAAVSLPRNVVLVISIICASSYGLDILGWGLLLSFIFEFLFLFPFVLRRGYIYNFFIDIKDRNLKETSYIIMPILLGMSVSQVNKIIDRSIASNVVSGGISALSYASIINNAVQEILVTGIITILFSNCSKLVAQGKNKAVQANLSSTVKTMFFCLIPASIGIILFAEPIVEFILYRGNFNTNSIVMTTGALKCYTIGLVFLAIRDTLVKVFYAYKKTRITTITSIVAILLNILLNLFLSKFWGINGLALATSFSAIFHCLILYFIFQKKIMPMKNRDNIMFFCKCLLSSAIMGFVGQYAYSYCVVNKLSSFNSLLITMFICFSFYNILTFCFKCNPMSKYINNIYK